jgi:hypothetical protein
MGDPLVHERGEITLAADSDNTLTLTGVSDNRTWRPRVSIGAAADTDTDWDLTWVTDAVWNKQTDVWDIEVTFTWRTEPSREVTLEYIVYETHNAE